MRPVLLADGADLAQWREAARALLVEGVPPDQVLWQGGAQAALPGALGSAQPDLLAAAAGVAGVQPDPLARPTPPWRSAPGEAAVPPGRGGDGTSPPRAPAPRPVPRVPRDFLELAGLVIAHADPRRHGVLYRLLWRIAHGERALLAMATDDDVAWAQRAARAVRREKHKMKAFVRFREVAGADGPVFIAWFEPEHDVLPQVAPFFARRFAGMRWSILTPSRSAHWDGSALRLGEGARRSDAPDADALEDLWRIYYASIFNPARLKVDAMVKEMPGRYWKHLPEAALIPALVRDAGTRLQAMVDAAPTEPRKAIPAPRDSAAARAPTPLTSAAPAAAAAAGLPALARAMSACRACPLWRPATQAVPGEGPADARVMVVGEQPGDQEDLAGRPFVGPAGQLFERALAGLGIDRGQLYLTNAVKHFKFESRGRRRLHVRADASEQAACRPWLEAELAALRPAAVLCLGATAAQAVLGRDFALMAHRGRWQQREDGLHVLATVHPSWVLRQPAAARETAWAGFVRDLELLAAGPPPHGHAA